LLVLRATEDSVATNAPPDHLNFATVRRSVLEGGTAVGRPGHLENAIRPRDALHPEPWTKGSRPKIVVKSPEDGSKSFSLGIGQ
jgi:hypothetical protein